MSGAGSKPGLQPERTQLSWERTAVGFVVIGAIVLFHHTGPLAPGRVVVAAMSFAMAIMVIVVGQLRGRTGSPRVAVLLVGWTTVALATVVCVLVLLAA